MVDFTQGVLQNVGALQGLAANKQAMDQQQSMMKQEQQADELLNQFQQGGGQDFSLVQKAVLLSPTKAKNVLATIGIADDIQKKQAASDIVTLRSALSDPATFRTAVAKRVQAIKDRGGDPTDTIGLVSLYEQGGPEAVERELGFVGAALANEGYIKPELLGFGKQEKPVLYQQGQGEMAGYVFDPLTGQYKVDQAARRAYVEAKAKKEAGEALGLKDKVTLNKEISTITKDATMIHRTAQDLERLSKIKSGPAAISMVYKFMKSLDPTSVVREGEFATAERAAGVPDTVLNYYNRLVNGERLPDSVIAEFVDTSKNLANTAIDSAEVEVNDYMSTFGDDFDQDFATRLKARVPKRFELKPQAKLTKEQFTGQQQAPAEQPKVIGRFQIEVVK